MLSRKIQLLIIEDDIDYVDIVRMCLDEPDSMGLKFEMERTDRLEVGLKLLETAPFDALLLDLSLPDSRGIETITKVIEKGHDLPILVMTNLGDEHAAFEAMRLGAQDYMVKATSDSRLLKRAIWYAIERHKMLAQTENLIRKSADAMIVIDAEGVVRYANPAAESLFETKTSDFIGRPFQFPALAGETKLLKLAADRTAEMRVTEIEWKGAPARLASIRDISGLQKVEQLRAEIKERRRLDELKDKLLGTVSHELRTPLTIIKGAIDNLYEGLAGPLQGRQGELIGIAHRNLARLSKMINNLLDLSRLESGMARITRRAFSPEALVSQALEDFQSTSKNRKIRLEAELSPNLPDVYADPELISEVLVNLVDNALRFAKSSVGISARVSGERVVISIVDDGEGIPADKIGDLFNKFVQINRSAGGGYKGTGLGLAICKEIMDLHGETITVESPPARARGSRSPFPRRWPARPPSPPEDGRRDEPARSGGRRRGGP
ncbi:MAG: response regulator, partial [Elusimicrobia bacterium]|nr:response regulator [Elusimicrobiota bacterium]